jgi:4-hydroxy-tetrahydrodipicolinate reductase
MLRIGVHGARGRMGDTVCRAVELDPELDLAATVDHGDDRQAFADAECAVVVDFSVAAASRETLPWLAEQGIHAVVGTTGLTDDDVASIRSAFETSSARCLLVSNFSISAVLMMHFAAVASPWFDTAEIIELHHDGKIDAPSGTAVTTARRMAESSDTWAADPTEKLVYDGARGGHGPGGIRIHAVRMRGMVAHQEVILGAIGQTLTIRQDSYDRESYMPGVVLACKHVAELPAGLTVGLEPLLGI